MPCARLTLLLLALRGCAWGHDESENDDYSVRFTIDLDDEHSGDVVVTVRDARGHNAAARFRELILARFYDGVALYRVVPGRAGYLQFGLHSNVTRQRAWEAAHGSIPAEGRIKMPDWNIRGTMAFVTSGPRVSGGGGTNSSRRPPSTQLLINLDDNRKLDTRGIIPFGRVVTGMNVLTRVSDPPAPPPAPRRAARSPSRATSSRAQVYSGYGEKPQGLEIRRRGGAYLREHFPRLSYIRSAVLIDLVDEPFMLSKNTIGLIVLLCMVAVTGCVCLVMRRFQQRGSGPAGKYKPTPLRITETDDFENEADFQSHAAAFFGVKRSPRSPAEAPAAAPATGSPSAASNAPAEGRAATRTTPVAEKALTDYGA